MEAGSALFTLGCKSVWAKFCHFTLTSLSIATYHAAGENKCEETDPDALRTLFAVFG